MLTLLSLAATFGVSSLLAEPIQLHPDNPKYFLFRGKPLVLLTATEHYGSVVNRPFDYRKYLADAADKKITLTRTFRPLPRTTKRAQPVFADEAGVA